MMHRAPAPLARSAAVLLFLVPFVAGADFCWKDSYGRGVGTIPNGCGSGQTLENGLCYSPCPSGYKAEGPVCWKTCPSGYTDSGAACTKSAPYGRGAGYPWKFGDKAFSLDGARARCAKDNPQGCEKAGEIIYPKCREGYRAIGSNICSPACPSGYADTGATCLKPTQTRGAGRIPTGCAAGSENDAGLCYTNCRSKFDGEGPVCWGQCPSSRPVNCGAGCATSSAECAQTITDQVVSVLDVAATIATTALTAGSGTAIKAGITTGARAAAKNVVIKGVSKATVRATITKLAKDAGKDLATATVENLASMAVGEDFDPYSLDPTGIASVVEAYNHPVCPT